MSPPFEKITSFQNAKIKQIRKLRDRRARDQEKRFVIDDGRDLGRALDNDYAVDYAFYCPALGSEQALLDRLAGANIYEVSRDMMEKVAYRQNPSPILAVMMQKPPLAAEALDALDVPRILALVDLQKPGNIGALLRTADAAGFQAVFLIDSALDIYNPNVIRSSTGACFLDNIYMLRSAQALDFLRQQGYTLIAAAVDGERSLFEVTFGHKSAIVLGTEDQGLADMWLKAADQRVRIPMAGHLADSLNVSVSGAIFMYEALRQTSRY